MHPLAKAGLAPREEDRYVGEDFGHICQDQRPAQQGPVRSVPQLDILASGELVQPVQDSGNNSFFTNSKNPINTIVTSLTRGARPALGQVSRARRGYSVDLPVDLHVPVHVRYSLPIATVATDLTWPRLLL